MMNFLRSTLLMVAFIGSQAFASEWSDYVKSVSARMALGSAESQEIESTYAQILGTASGTHICFLVKGDVETLSHLLGTSESGGGKLIQLCDQQIQSLVGTTIQFKTRGLKERMLQRPAKTYYIVPESARFPYDSWTDLENNTFISATALREGKLTRVLIHELQIAFDDRDNLLNNWDQQEDWIASNRQDLRNMMKLIYESPLRRVFAVMRAFNYETAVINELQNRSVKTDLIQMLDNSKCIQMGEAVIRSMTGKYSEKEKDLLQSAWSQVRATGLSFTLINKLLNMRTLDKATPTFSLCQFMALPFVVATAHVSEGPRPRIVPPVGNGGSGGGMLIDGNSDVNRKEALDQFHDNQSQTFDLTSSKKTLGKPKLMKVLDIKGDSDAIPSVESIKD